MNDFQRWHSKGKYLKVALRRNEIDTLDSNILNFDQAFKEMCEKTREYKGDFAIQFRNVEFQSNLRSVLNHHINVQFPGLKSGFFPEHSKSALYLLSHGKTVENSESSQIFESDKSGD